MTGKLARQIIAVDRELTARERIAKATAHIPNTQDRAVARFNLWAAEPDARARDMRECVL